uniref:Uncharacterized protein n=1 Tax=Eucampia antarctica TaxID=49252 RepID=A0A7S2W4Q0_9STRA|mmetsp:Transcript_20437/g.19653  ORF Transcript_20437/g.19653 Transcript_20437/m.19653 type:complete len:163 (+) Transcript_20437:58-546(+)|eukprot:CAMPEP_0197832068 /NCGR_PEP_ID=MMETSP1437-20131217/13150_1 /TAXON_ID=49252 ORGANISM="Eucampia antarctica, Strain CCMP1452" /NCGR_SAMPLE_ID=MMETSP1437 /ASSEMBLY_ACC=CAM_ASM_001096 /LENGTH=162 /DNA_ID=CAMNT_0043435247 /DNA_START=52 /DNA_END=540 /DNA_ORIENTATION=+
MAAGGFGFGGASSSSSKIDESTPWVAAGEGNIELLQEAMEKLNLPINAADSNGFTFVHAAASYNQIETLRWILSKDGVDVNASDTDGDTPLHHCDKSEAAKILVEEGSADFQITNNDGKTALEVKLDELEECNEDENDSDDEDDLTSLKLLVKYLQILKGIP